MKKHFYLKRCLAAGLGAAMLALSMSACGGNESSGSSKSSDGSSADSSTSTSLQTGQVSQAGTLEKGNTSLPLTEEPVTLRMWFQITAATRGDMKDYNDNDFYQWLEEQTNVHIEWIMPVEGTEQESFNLLFASDDMPDMIENVPPNMVYSSGPDMAIEDDVYLRLNELCDQYAPNYMALINANPQLQKDSVTDDGNRWSFDYLYKEGRLGNQGPAIRQDFLNKIDMDVPVTFDDWHEVLTAFKEKLNIEIPLFYSSSKNDGTAGNFEFMTGFNTARDFFLDGKTVLYGPMEDGYNDYLDMMKQWYAEGLIDQSFSTRNGVMDDDLILNDKIGAAILNNTYCGDSYYPSRGATNPDFNLVGTSVPVKSKGDVTHLRCVDRLINGMLIAISTSTKYPELCVRWLDYQYTDEASLIANYGNREGESYIIQDDGTYKWGELITNNPDGMTQNQARGKYTTMNAPFEDYNRVMGAWSDTQKDAQKIWTQSTSLDDGMYPEYATMTAEEQEEYAAIMGDITTFVAEYTVNSIMGQQTQGFDDFRNQLKNMGIERAIELKQASIDRYNAR